MKILKGIWNCVVSFLFCLILIAGFVVILLSNTLLNKQYVLKQLEKNDYYGRIQTDLKNGFEEHQYQSGFPDQVFENLFTNELVKEDINSLVDHLYEGSEIRNHTEFVREQIAKNMNQYFSENNINMSEQEQRNVDEYQKLIVNIYEDKINILPNSVIEKGANIIPKIQKVIGIAEKVIIGTIVVIIVVILSTNWRTLKDGICVIGTGLLSAGILLQLMRFVVTKNIDIKNILLFNQSLSDLAKQIISEILLKFTSFGLMFIVIGMLTIIVVNYFKIQKSEK